MWSEAARKAAAEARRRSQHGSATNVTVTSARGAKVNVSRNTYASKLRRARQLMREHRPMDKEVYDKARIQREHASTKRDAGAFAAADKRRRVRVKGGRYHEDTGQRGSGPTGRTRTARAFKARY